MFLSGSSDKTAKIWKFRYKENLVNTLKGHNGQISSIIQMQSGMIVTASIDKSLKVWSSSGKYFYSFNDDNGYTGLAVVSSTEFLASTDVGTVQLWNIDTNCLQFIFSDHSLSVCSVAAINEELFVSSGRDNTVIVYFYNSTIETIQSSSVTPWCLDILPNNNVLVGCSDGSLRIYMRDESKVVEVVFPATKADNSSQLEDAVSAIEEVPDSEAAEDRRQRKAKAGRQRKEEVQPTFELPDPSIKRGRLDASPADDSKCPKQLYEVKVEYKRLLSYSQIENAFKLCGTIKGIDRENSFALVRFPEEKHLLNALLLNGSTVDGTLINVKQSKYSVEAMKEVYGKHQENIKEDAEKAHRGDAYELADEDVPRDGSAAQVVEASCPSSLVVSEIEKLSMADPGFKYVTPVSCVNSVDDMEKWKSSESYSELVVFITAMNDAVKGKSLKVDCDMSPVSCGIISLLEQFNEWIDEIPPIDQACQAFSTWYDKLEKQVLALHHRFIPAKLHPAIPEVMAYILQSFGNPKTMEYGTCNEMSFIMFLLCLCKVGALLDADRVAIVTKVFNRYLLLVRKLISQYRIKAATSHTVWKLDGFHFVPFIWGSSQICLQAHLEPKSCLETRVLETFASDYMFLSCIQFNKVNEGAFAVYSGQLPTLSKLSSWSKINSRLITMYKLQVLDDFEVIRHIKFGSLLSFKQIEQTDLVVLDEK